MIIFNNLPLELQHEQPLLKRWLKDLVRQHEYIPGDIVYFFCNDEELLEINQQFLRHDTYTDIITFDYCVSEVVSGEIHISEQRVRDNATELQIPAYEELLRVLAHGVLHLCGFKDKKEEEATEMRKQETAAIKLFQELKYR